MAGRLRQGEPMPRGIDFRSKSDLQCEARRTVIPCAISVSISIGVGGTKGAITAISSIVVGITAITTPIPSVMTYGTA